jgi:flagellar basal-body rod modification protein FlgD
MAAVGGLSSDYMYNAEAAQAYRQSLSETSAKDSMTMQDFLMLVVAQMSNQDINNTYDDSQLMSTMAQIASMQAMQELTAAFMSSMSMSYMGKYVKAVATTDDGQYTRLEGYVDRVSFNGGEASVLVNEAWFKVQDVYEVYLAKPEEKPAEEQVS